MAFGIHYLRRHDIPEATGLFWPRWRQRSVFAGVILNAQNSEMLTSTFVNSDVTSDSSTRNLVLGSYFVKYLALVLMYAYLFI
jgi:hypothetical protein